MPRKKIIIPEQQLRHLYCEKKMTIRAIGELVGCCRETVVSRIKDCGLHLRKLGEWQTKYKKQDFSGDEIEKAYLLGFRMGDLSVHRPYKNSKIIVVRCHTTQQDQIRVMENLFQKYGSLVISRSWSGDKKPSFIVNCNLNKSFFFLIPSKFNQLNFRTVKRINNSAAFVAGYTDAEGNFIINQGKARFKIDSYDYFILNWIYKWAGENEIKARLRLIASKGSKGYNKGRPLRKNLWRLNINEAYSLLRFCALILPFSKHRKRIKDMLACALNIIQRKENETI